MGIPIPVKTLSKGVLDFQGGFGKSKGIDVFGQVVTPKTQEMLFGKW